MPPVQFDFLTSIPGLEFSDSWERRKEVQLEGQIDIIFIGLDDLRTAKAHAGRPQDLVDLESLQMTDE